jgi:acyl-CoA synthetase (NDP forming)
MPPAAPLTEILSPRSIAVVGASDSPDEAGGRPIFYLKRFGFQGSIYSINPQRSHVQGLPAYASLAALPEVPDLWSPCRWPARAMTSIRSRATRRGWRGKPGAS